MAVRLLPERGSPAAAAPLLPPAQAYLPVGGGYFASERSFAQLRLPDTQRALVGFGREPTTLLVVSASGGFFKASFDPEKGGACEQQSYAQWLGSSGGGGGGGP